MSVGRDVIARVHECSEEDVRCDKCARSEDGRLFNCTFWDSRTHNDDFCSFFSLKHEKDEQEGEENE